MISNVHTINNNTQCGKHSMEITQNVCHNFFEFFSSNRHSLKNVNLYKEKASYKLSISAVKAQIVAKMLLVTVKDKGSRILNQLRNLSRTEQAEKYHEMNIERIRR